MKTLTMVLGAMSAMLLAGCSTDEDTAREAIRNAGYEDIELGEYSSVWDNCGSGEDEYKFTAEMAGARVSGFVCCSPTSFKGCTIRH